MTYIMHQSIPVYELALEIQAAYLIRRTEARLVGDYEQVRSALLKAVDQYRTALEEVGYTIQEFDLDNSYIHGEDV